MQPLVSVIIPLFNREELVTETIFSALSQTYDRLEIIVVDDCSEDRGPARVRAIARGDHRVQLISGGVTRSGAPVCRNKGFERSSGEFVVFLDSDDLLARDCIRHRVSELVSDPEADFATAQGLVFFDEPGDSRLLWNRCEYGTADLIGRFLDQDMPWNTSGPLWRRDAFERTGQWKTELECFQDWELHLRACIFDLKPVVIPVPDFFVRRSADADHLSNLHHSVAHVESRLRAFESVVDLLESRNQMKGEVATASKGFLLRNQLSIHDSGIVEARIRRILDEIGVRLLNPIDKWILRWIESKGDTWHWDRRVKRVTNFWWKGLEFDALCMSIGFMKLEWSGDLPSVDRSVIEA